MQIEKLLAEPYAQSIRLRVGPGESDVVFIDEAAWEQEKENFIQFCDSIPNLEGASWQLLRLYTEQNGLMAKVIIALGELAEIWRMHPSPDYPEMWQTNMYPMITGYCLHVEPRVPKPSKDEMGTSECLCCFRPMGPMNSPYHDLWLGQDFKCVECSAAHCGDRCLIGEARKEGEEPPGLLEYLQQFGE